MDVHVDRFTGLMGLQERILGLPESALQEMAEEAGATRCGRARLWKKIMKDTLLSKYVIKKY